MAPRKNKEPVSEKNLVQDDNTEGNDMQQSDEEKPMEAADLNREGTGESRQEEKLQEPALEEMLAKYCGIERNDVQQSHGEKTEGEPFADTEGTGETFMQLEEKPQGNSGAVRAAGQQPGENPVVVFHGLPKRYQIICRNKITKQMTSR